MTFQLLSKRRAEIMGFAIIYIMVFHLFLYRNFLIINPFKSGSVGVDMFLLLSGLGIYFSLNKKNTLGTFYVNRLIRILPTFWTVVIPYSIYLVLIGRMSIGMGFVRVSSLALFWGDKSFWYVTAILMCYLLSPFFFAVIGKATNMRRLSLLLLAVFMIGYILALLVGRGEIMLTRLPIFFLGMFVGKCLKEKVEIKLNIYVILAIGILGLIVCDLIREISHISILKVRLAYALFSLPICFLVAYICENTKCFSLNKTLNYFGKRSFEFYLVSTPLMSELARSNFSNWEYLIFCVVGTFFVTNIVVYIMDRITPRLKNTFAL